MTRKNLILVLVGIVLVSALFVWLGVEPVVAELREAGWPLLLVCVFALPEQALSTQAWRMLFARRKRPRFGRTFAATWMGAAVNTLLPVATIGGEIVKARLITKWGSAITDALSTVVVDKTVQASVICLWGFVGIGFLAMLVPGDAAIWSAAAGGLALAAGIGGFIVVHLRGGFSFLARLASRAARSDKWTGLVQHTEDLDEALRDVYRRPGAIAASIGIRLASRVVLVGELVLASHLMGAPLGLAEAIMLKGLIAAIRGVSFAVPGSLGFQEGGYVAFGALLGLPPHLMLALSLATRLREVLPSIPLLFAWQVVEGRALGTRAATGSATPPIARDS